jgi:predicted deacetylase
MSKRRIFVVFRNDDPSAAMDLQHERDIFGLFEEFGAPQTIAVVPKIALKWKERNSTGETSLLENPAAVDFLKSYVQRTASEICLHGYTHRINRFSIPTRKEFTEFKYLPETEQKEMIRAGIAILEQCFGARPVTFVPPWNRWDQNTLKACASNGLRIISAGAYVTQTEDLLSIGANTDFSDFSRAYQAARNAAGPVFLVVLFHSNTLTPQQRNLARQALETIARDPECQVVTVRELAERFPKQVDQFNRAARTIVDGHEVPGSRAAKAWPYVTLLQKAGWGEIEDLRGRARILYDSGDYNGCAELGPMIDRVSKAVLWLARGGAIVAGMGLGAWLSVMVPPRAAALALGALFLGIGAMAAHRAIARDTRAEMMTTAAAAAIGSVVSAFARGWIH